MGRIIELATGFPGYDARIPRSCWAAARDAGAPRLRGLGGGQMAPDPRGRDPPRRAAATAGRSGAGFERFYGFFAGETHQNAPALVHDSHHVRAAPTARGRLPPDRGPGRPGHRVPRRPPPRRRRQALAPATCAPGACHSPHQAPAEWIEPTAAASTGVGRLARGDSRAAEGARRRPRARPSCPLDPTGCRPGTRLSDRRAPSVRPLHGGVRRLPHPHRRPDRPGHRPPGRHSASSTTRIVMVMSDNGASSEGGPVGSLNDVRTWNAAARTRSTRPSTASTRSAGPASTTTTRGAGRWPATRRSGAGSARPTRAAWPIRCIVHWPAGIPADQARHEPRRQYVHAIDIVPTILEAIGIEPPDRARAASTQQPDRRDVSFAPHHRRRRTPPTRTSTQYYEMFGCRALYEDGWKAVTYHDIQFDEPGLDQVPWELYDLRADPVRVPTTSPRREPERLERDDRPLVGGGRAPPGPARRQPALLGAGQRPADVPARAGTHDSFWPERSPVPERQAPRTQSGSHRSPPTSWCGARPSAPLSGVLAVQGNVWGVGACTAWTGSWSTSTT